jgi:hypothetical protein
MRRRYSYQLDPLRVWLLLRLRRRCGWRRVCRGRSRSRARQQIPNEDQGKDNCRCDYEQPVCVHRVCPGSLWPTTLAPLGALEQVKPSGRTNITWPCGPRSKLKHVTPWSRRTPRALSFESPGRFCKRSRRLCFVAPHVRLIDSQERRESNSLGERRLSTTPNSASILRRAWPSR